MRTCVVSLDYYVRSQSYLERVARRVGDGEDVGLARRAAVRVDDRLRPRRDTHTHTSVVTHTGESERAAHLEPPPCGVNHWAAGGVGEDDGGKRRGGKNETQHTTVTTTHSTRQGPPTCSVSVTTPNGVIDMSCWRVYHLSVRSARATK